MFWGSILLILASNVLYHAAQKSVPRAVDPLLATAVAYAVALPVTLLLWWARGDRAALGPGLAALNWANVMVGVAIVGVEVGFLVAYRAGWQVSVAAATANAGLIVALAILGWLAFRERIEPHHWAGLALCLGGLALLARR